MGKNQTVLFHSTVFGPIHSRRLGVSLGINLMPNDGKICTFDCLYCEAGYNKQGPGKSGLPTVDALRDELKAKLEQMKEDNLMPDVITFSGNGEPTLHPDFPEIMKVVTDLRNEYAPLAKVSVLSNSTRIFDASVADALKMADNNILKLDSAIESTMRVLDRPTDKNFTVQRVVEALKLFSGEAIIQTLFVRGEHDGVKIDNTTQEEVEALIEAYKAIKPKEVMVYSIDRTTPEENLIKVPREELEEIAIKIRAAGINTQVN